MSHISYNDENWQSYTVPKEVPKTIWITWHTAWVLLTAFFYRKSANFAISRNTDIDPFRYLISNSSNFSWVFKGCFNKNGHSFDDVNKNGYVRPS